MAAAKIKKGDRVVVLSGKDKGKHGDVTQAMPKDGKVIVVGRQHRDAPPQAEPGQPAGRPRAHRSAAARFEGRDRGSEDGQADARPLRDPRRQEGPRRREVRGD